MHDIVVCKCRPELSFLSEDLFDDIAETMLELCLTLSDNEVSVKSG